MLEITGYTIDGKISESPGAELYRGRNGTGNGNVLFKTVKGDRPSLNDLARLTREYEASKVLANKGILKVLDLEAGASGPVLIMEDFGGVTLKECFLPHKPTLPEFLKTAISITATLEEIHGKGVVHRDINSSNILFNPQTGETKITGFGHASFPPSWDGQDGVLKGAGEGTPAYMSPEQTGRMNRPVDHRSDFYSLGVVFYEMLTGGLPFNAADPLDLVYCHIARIPAPPREVDPRIPAAVSGIIMKMLSKSVEERYQSACGLREDLKTCLAHYEADGVIPAFTLGEKDMGGIFTVSPKLYGREREIAVLTETFRRTVAGRTEILLVSGYSGVGKSSLVNELSKTVAGQKGFFVSGKFDQFKRNTPYSALIHALQALIRRILGGSEKELESWKNRILEAAGPNCKIIAALIPELELLAGVQPPVQELPPAESENRFYITFQNIIGAFAGGGRPLVIFLDDLQWADAATLNLLAAFASVPALGSLLFVGAYRDNEVGPLHPLELALEGMKKAGAVIGGIVLQPLNGDDAGRLIADTLCRTEAEAAPLAALVMEKTHGNPFFTGQFLKTLHQERLLEFDPAIGGRRWDLEKIKSKGITDNVAELMIGKIRMLSPDSQEILMLAACIGGRFDIETFSAAGGRPLNERSFIMGEILREGLLIVETNDGIAVPEQRAGYKFLHDRVQQAAYSLISEPRKKEIHVRIGRALQKRYAEGGFEEGVFEIANHLNLGLELGTDAAEREGLAALNLAAGKRAKASAVHDAALKYFRAGMAQLPENGWQTLYGLTYALNLECAECEYIVTHFGEAEALFETVRRNARTRLDVSRVYAVKVVLYENMGRPSDAVGIGLEGLAELGIDLRGLPVKLLLAKELAEVKWRLGKMKPDDVLRLPVMTGEEKIAAMNLLMRLIPSAYFVDSYLVMLLTLEMVKVSLIHGNADCSPFAYAVYGVFEGSIMGKYKRGFEFGAAAMKLCEGTGNTAIRGKVRNVFGGYIYPWTEHAKPSGELLLNSYRDCLATGDLTYAAYSGALMNTLSFLTGENLETVYRKAERYAEFCAKVRYREQEDSHITWRQAVLALRGLSHGTSVLSTDRYDEESHVRKMQNDRIKVSLYVYYFIKTHTLYLYGHYALAAEFAAKAESGISDVLLGLMTAADFHFYHSLVAAALYPQADTRMKMRYSLILRRNRGRMKKWAENCPANFLHKYLLIEAEICRIRGKGDKAAALYERAVTSARENGYIHLEAIGNELAAKLQLERGFGRLAKTYMEDARYCYEKWGAAGKVKNLEEKYPDLLSKQTTKPFMMPGMAAEGGMAEFDMASVIKASHAISSSFELDKVLKNLMMIVIQNAGARKGVLIMEKSGRFHVVAEAIGDPPEISIKERPPDENGAIFPSSIVNYAARTGKVVLINDAAQAGEFSADPYFERNHPLSIMCLPLGAHGKRMSILYLENNLTPNAFTPERAAVLNLLSAQITVSLENAILYKEKEDILRTVHDSLSADIYNIILLSEPRHNGGSADQDVMRRQEMIHAMSRSCLENIKDVLFSADNENATLNALTDRIINYCGKVLRPLGVAFTYEDKTDDGETVFSPTVIFNINMIFKEAICNTIRHSGASSVVMRAERGKERLHLSLHDNGAGCKIDETSPRGRGIGNMRQRAETIGATLTIDSTPGKGTVITLTVAV